MFEPPQICRGSGKIGVRIKLKNIVIKGEERLTRALRRNIIIIILLFIRILLFIIISYLLVSIYYY